MLFLSKIVESARKMALLDGVVAVMFTFSFGSAFALPAAPLTTAQQAAYDAAVGPSGAILDARFEAFWAANEDHLVTDATGTYKITVNAYEGLKEEAKAALPQEVTVTQELRQEGYDRKTTTDDHGMHIFGLAKDQNGNKYFMVKNSWGETGKYKGIWYASETFVKYKTLNIVVHKDALPKHIAKKLGIK